MIRSTFAVFTGWNDLAANDSEGYLVIEPRVDDRLAQSPNVVRFRPRPAPGKSQPAEHHAGIGPVREDGV